MYVKLFYEYERKDVIAYCRCREVVTVQPGRDLQQFTELHSS
jgi:hypothetical protein